MALRALQGPAGGAAPVGGTGTTNTIPRWTGPSTLGDSQLKDNGTLVGIGASLTSGNRLVIGGVASGTSFIKANEATFQIGNIFAGPVQILTADAPQVTVTGTGFVGIGTASPAALLHVNGNQVGGAGASVTPYAQALFGPSSAYTMWWKTNATAGGGLIGAAGPSLYFYVASGTPNAPTLLQVANFDSTGNLILNTANTGATIQAAGSQQGLKLPATPGNTDPNTLDCYADGGTANSGGVAWTPTLNFGGATTGITYAANGQVGRYTRVGNMVYLTMYIRLSSKGSATGNATITGLPTSANVPGLHASGAVGIIANITFANQMTAALLANSAELRLYETTNAGLVTTITDADFAANSELAISIAYSVN